MKLQALVVWTALTGVALVPEARGGDWYVSASAAAGGTGSSEAPFQTIQAAIDAASAEDTVYVRPGTYDQGSTNAWKTTYSSCPSFYQQTRVYVTKKLTIVSTGGKAVTKIVGSHGSRASTGSPGTLLYREDGVQCMVIGADAVGTVIRGFTFSEGLAHQSSSANAFAAGGICYATPRSANDFLVTDSEFVHCAGRGGGGIHGGMAIRCTFRNCLTNNRGPSAYESRLYNCLSCDVSFDAVGNSTWDFCDSIVINCTTFNGYARGGFNRSSSTGFGGKIYNSITFGNLYGSKFSQLTGTLRGLACNTLTDDDTTCYDAESTDLTSITNSDEATVKQLYVSPWVHDFRPVKGGLLEGKGKRDYLTAAGDDFVIPAEELLKDFEGNAIAADAALPIGIVMTSAEVKTGVLKLTSPLAVDGYDCAPSPTFFQSDHWPVQVRISQSERRKTVNGEKTLLALSDGTYVRYFGRYPEIVQLLPKPGTTQNFTVWTMSAELYVGGTGASDSNAGTSDAPFATIQKAIDTAVLSTPTIIHVRAGTYGAKTGTYANEPGDLDTDSINSGIYSSLNIPKKKNLLIISDEGPEKTFIEGAPDPETATGIGPKATRCATVSDSANVAFSGFTFRNGYCDTEEPTDQDQKARCYGAAVGVGNASYQQFYDCVFTNNNGKGVANQGLYVRCRFTGNTNVSACVIYASTLSACLFENNGNSKTSYILYNYVYAFNTSLYEPVCGKGTNLQNKNGYVVNNAYESCGNMINFNEGYVPIVGSVIKAGNCNAQTFPENMTYADPYFRAPWTGDYRLQKPSAAAGYGVASDPNGKITEKNFLLYLGGDFENRNLVRDDGTIHAGAVAEALEEGEADVYADAVNGDDANDGIGEAHAKKTLTAAMSVRIPGNAKYVALPGTYKEGSAVHVGNSFGTRSATNPIRANPTVASRVIVPEGCTLVSRDGAATTIIEGEADPDGNDPYKLGRGPNAVRCVFLERNATIRGFTITNGHTDYYIKSRDGENASYQDDFYGAGVFGRAKVANSNGVLDGTRVEHCIVKDNYADLGGAGGCVAFHNCVVTGNWGANWGGFYRHGASYNCFVDNCRGGRMCDVTFDCVNCTFGPGNLGTGGAETQPFANIQSTTRIWNTLILSLTSGSLTLGKGELTKNLVIPSEVTPKCSDSTTPEHVDNTLSATALRAYYDANGKATAKDAPTVDQGTTSALALLDGTDAEGAARVKNALPDIGAFEYDWKGDYAKAIGKHLVVTDENGVVEEDGVVKLLSGSTMTVAWKGPAAHDITATVNGPGTLTVTLNGATLGTLDSSKKLLSFTTTEKINTLVFAYTGDAGYASVDLLKRFVGLRFIIQ